MSRSKIQAAVLEVLESRRMLSATPKVMGYLEDFKVASTSQSSINYAALNEINYFSVLPDATPAYDKNDPSTTPEQQATSDGGFQSLSDSGYTVSSQLPDVVGNAHTNGVNSVNVYATIGAGDPNAIYDMDALVNSSQSVWSAFATNCKTLCNNDDLAGVDLDWEPSIQGFTVTSTQIENFGKLVQTVHNAFSGTGLTLTSDALGDPVALSTSTGDSTGNSAYMLSALAVENLDAINVEAYPVTSESDANTIMSQWADYVTGKASSINPSGTDVDGDVAKGSISKLQYGLDIAADDSSNTTSVIQDKVDTTIKQGYGGLFLFDLSESNAYTDLSTISSEIAKDTSSSSSNGSVSGTVLSSTGAGVANEVVYLDANNNSKLDSTELKATTNSSGAYTISNVPAGSYIVRQVLASGTTQTSPSGNTGVHITVTGGANLTGEDFTDKVASSAPSGGSVSGSVLTSSGAAVANVTVYLDANNNSKLDSGELSMTTTSSGTFAFSNVPAGAYIIRQVLPTGDTQTSPSGNTGLHITVTNGGSLTGEKFTDTVPKASSGGSITGTVKTSSGTD